MAMLDDIMATGRTDAQAMMLARFIDMAQRESNLSLDRVDELAAAAMAATDGEMKESLLLQLAEAEETAEEALLDLVDCIDMAGL